MVCPHCNQEALSSPVGFTWWGGFIGAKLINHVECSSCRGRYNGNSGKPNTTAIAIYIIVISLIAFGATFALTRH
jgi:hypothetical protein